MTYGLPMSTPRRPLHDTYPALGRQLPHVCLADLPTPVRDASGPAGRVLLKLDGSTSSLYGGNKVRKLEYALAQAKSHDCTAVATFGAAGSNHATATAMHAQAQGLHCVTFLSRQRMTPWLASNLRRQLHSNAHIVFVDGNRSQREQQARDFLHTYAHKTWQIPMGGSSVIGTLGYVNAGLELAEQIRDAGDSPPDRVYVPLGTMGTAVGLALGFACARLPTQVMAVRVVHETVGSEALAIRLFEKTARLMRRLDSAVPQIDFDPKLLRIRNAFFGVGYAAATQAGREALDYAKAHWSLSLETTYTGKTVAAMLHDMRQADAPARPLLWCTYSDSIPVPPLADDWAQRLPSPLQRYVDS